MQVHLRAVEIGVAFLIIVFTAFAWIQSGDIPRAAQHFPRAVLILMMLTSTFILVRALKARDAQPTTQLFGAVGPFFGVLAALIIYVIAINLMGYFTATLLFIPAVPLILRAGRFWQSLLVALIFCAITYIIIIWAFERRLPPELWIEWLIPS